MPCTLIIETSTPQASIALAGPGDTREQHHFTSDRNHNALLFEPLNALLQGEAREQLELVLVGSGPGSYSGTRVGIAAAQGVALALQCPAVAVPSILAVPSAANGAACLAVGDARRGSFWSAMMENSELIHEPQLCDAAALALAIEHAIANDVPVVSFEDAGRFPIDENLRQALRTEFPDALHLWQAWQSCSEATRARWQMDMAQPIYLKPPHITPGKRLRLIQP